MIVYVKIMGGQGNGDIGFSRSVSDMMSLPDGSTVGDLLYRGIKSRESEIWNRVFDPFSRELRNNTIVFINNRAIQLLDGLNTPLNSSDVVMIGKSYSEG